MNPDQQWQACPQSLELDDGKRRETLERNAHYYALEGAIPPSLAGDVAERLDAGLVILRGPPPAEDAPRVKVLPVYTKGERSPPAVATGRVFIRLERVEQALSLASRLASLGLSIEEVPPYATNCAWLVPKSGIVADALRRLDELRALPRVEHVEPELLRQLALKLPDR